MEYSRARERERERERGERVDDNDIYVNVKEYTKMTMGLKSGVEPIWFEIMAYAS